MSPQLILTLSQNSDLQLEFPGPNGARQILPLEGEAEDILFRLKRMLLAQQSGQFKIGSEGRPTSHQLQHELLHLSSVRDNCPFCELGLQHSERFCNNSKAFDIKVKKAKRQELNVSATAEELGF